MKYVHQYCKAFRREVREMHQQIDFRYESICEEMDDNNERLDEFACDQAWEQACKEVTGSYDKGKFIRELAENWKDFPDRWPWLEGAESRRERKQSRRGRKR